MIIVISMLLLTIIIFIAQYIFCDIMLYCKSVWSSGTLSGMQPIDPNKVTTFLNALNQGTDPANPLWIEVSGTSALIKMDIEDAGKITFNGNSGFPVKAFINTQTGELKLFNARRFSRS